jgi:dethiobiotin synthetase
MPIVVTGTDTGIGKTVFAAALTEALGARYWKPVQSGLEDETDTDTVRFLAGVAADDILPECYRLPVPASPHWSAEQAGVQIDPAMLNPPISNHMASDRLLVIEGAGGLMVPLNRQTLFIDLFAAWAYPVVLCARTALGTINHTLLSVEALRRRQIPLLGIAFIGDAVPDTERTIADFAQAKVLGRLPLLSPLTPATLRAAFSASFQLADFAAR